MDNWIDLTDYGITVAGLFTACADRILNVQDRP